MTGLYPSQHGIYNNVSNEMAIHHGLNDGVELFSQCLQQNGYDMYFSGKWHVTDEENPIDRGWNELFVTAPKNNYMGVSIDGWREKPYDPDKIPLPVNYSDTMDQKPGAYKRMRKLWDQLSEREVKESIAHYWGYCTLIDDLFGKVLEALDRTGLEKDTLVIFMSDHGESLGSHGLYLKGISPYDETYRVPCIMRWPAGITHPGREVDELVSLNLLYAKNGQNEKV